MGAFDAMHMQDTGSSSSSSSGSGSSSSSSDSEASSSSSDDSADEAAAGASNAVINRDGTYASASKAELKLAARLAKDPWGRCAALKWGGVLA